MIFIVLMIIVMINAIKLVNWLVKSYDFTS
jgi:hypothetical protein